MGQNPTSGVLSLQRRRDIYELCCKYDVIIVEDDPYWYLQYPTATAKNTTTTFHPSNQDFNPDVPMFANAEPRPAGWKSSGYDFLDSIVPSSIQIDTEGRVIRLDTFSKTVAPGCRVGWITAQPAVIEKIQYITETSTQQPSGFVQSMLAELLLGPDHSGIESGKPKDGKGGLQDGKGWKADGWVRWIEGLRGNYERRMNKMATIIDNGKYLVKSGRRSSLGDDEEEWSVIEKKQIMSFDWPVSTRSPFMLLVSSTDNAQVGGMFLWLKIVFENHPLYSTFKKSSEMERLARALWLFLTTKPYLVLASPGGIFSPSAEIRERDGWKYFRLCFAAVNDDEVEPISHRLVDGINAFFRIKDRKTIEKLLEEEDASVADRVGTVAGVAQMLGPC